MNVILACFAGMSTSLLVTKIEAAVKAKALGWTVEALPASSAPSAFAEADIILLAPQTRYMFDEFQQNFPDTRIKLIPMDVYGMMNAEKIIALVNEA